MTAVTVVTGVQLMTIDQLHGTAEHGGSDRSSTRPALDNAALHQATAECNCPLTTVCNISIGRWH